MGGAGTHSSNDLQGIANRRKLSVFEPVFELFLNVEVTPAAYVTIKTQVVDSVVNSHDTVVATGARLAGNVLMFSISLLR